MELEKLLIICPLVFLAGLIDSIAGGGGLISLPAYMIAGVPTHMALGTNKFSSTFGTTVSSIRFFASKKINFKIAAISAVFALIGSMIGSKTVQLISPVFIKYLLILVIPIVAAVVLKKKNFGTENKSDEIPQTRIVVYSVLAGLVIGFWDGFFGPGTGTFLILIYTGLMKFDLITASGNTKLVNLASNVGALAVFLNDGQVAFAFAIPAAFFGILGNYIGSGLAIKKGSKVIKPIFILVLGILIVKMITDVTADLGSIGALLK